MSPRHGTAYHYDLGCHCEKCSKAKFASRRASRARARAANNAAYQHELRSNRARKETYRGTCERCGAATTGCDGPGLAPRFCRRHAAQLRALGQRGHGPTVERVLTLIEDGTDRFTDIGNAAGISKGHTTNVLNRLVSYGLIERIARGRYRVTEITA